MIRQLFAVFIESRNDAAINSLVKAANRNVINCGFPVRVLKIARHYVVLIKHGAQLGK